MRPASYVCFWEFVMILAQQLAAHCVICSWGGGEGAVLLTCTRAGFRLWRGGLVRLQLSWMELRLARLRSARLNSSVGRRDVYVGVVGGQRERRAALVEGHLRWVLAVAWGICGA